MKKPGSLKPIGLVLGLAVASAMVIWVTAGSINSDNVEAVEEIINEDSAQGLTVGPIFAIEILKDSDLIEIVKIEESRGAVTKYYGTSAKLLDFILPPDFDKYYSKLISKTSLKLAKVVDQILKNFPKTRKVHQINYNNYITMEIINRAMTNLLEKK